MISAWRKSTVSPLGFIHFKVSVPPAKTTPSPPTFIHYRKMNKRWLGHLPPRFHTLLINVWRPWGNTVPPWASYFSHAICKLTFSNRRCPPPMFIHYKKCMKGRGGVQNPWGGWFSCKSLCVEMRLCVCMKNVSVWKRLCVKVFMCKRFCV